MCIQYYAYHCESINNCKSECSKFYCDVWLHFYYNGIIAAARQYNRKANICRYISEYSRRLWIHCSAVKPNWKIERKRQCIVKSPYKWTLSPLSSDLMGVACTHATTYFKYSPQQAITTRHDWFTNCTTVGQTLQKQTRNVAYLEVLRQLLIVLQLVLQMLLKMVYLV